MIAGLALSLLLASVCVIALALWWALVDTVALARARDAEIADLRAQKATAMAEWRSAADGWVAAVERERLRLEDAHAPTMLPPVDWQRAEGDA